MRRFVIGADVALELARTGAAPGIGTQLAAPTLLRSELVSLLYRSVRAGELTRQEANDYLDHVRGLRIRLLGDRVLQRTAWDIAERLSWPDTLTAEYLALTRLQADAFTTLDPELAKVAATVVPVATLEDVLGHS
ncbi:type II toxin-antitoxin system VapC family toxin [Georgenia sunbinii]|uniref:type II toxin-antitoxin system VapC family toxin n=1 Tax=Georgenia sunbinii TaxID=3117728 RepID=UPI002F264305